ncbi:MAG: Alpha-amylase precursor [Tenericutes bacterium ADurb.BinA155]|nr:MAG: Alpha-amylase precursor [Tenericutes bacterium ADurb.BinA155]
MKKRYLVALGFSCFFGVVAASCGSTPTTAQATVTFYAGYGAFSGVDTKEVKVNVGEKVSAPSDPSRDGFVFAAWCESYDPSSKNGTGDSFDFSTVINANMTLYAKWTKSGGSSHTDEQVKAYMKGLASSSAGNHLYVHYYRYDNQPSSYADWDIWVWQNQPTAGEGHKFDWTGRTQDASSPTLAASGNANVDDFGGAVIDVDLSKVYDGGWDNTNKKMGGTKVSYQYTDVDSGESKLCWKVGYQIVQSSSRTATVTSGDGFWSNDGSNQFAYLDDFKMANDDGTTSYHVFYLQDNIGNNAAKPYTNASDPFDNDDGTNVTYGNSAYVNAIDNKAVAATSPEFLKGKEGDSSSVLANGAGVGYQIMVSSFADSDGDGFGDIYGVEQKLDYIKNLGVNVLWLTPIQKSDSYHGYDITDYSKVDPKFGSSKSPAALANHGVVTSDTALADYQSLINAAHAKGMVVIMDLVLNHTSTGNNWFAKSAQLDSTYRGFYQWGNNVTQSDHIKPANFWYPYGDHVYSYYAKFGSSMPELNYMYAPTREAVADMAKGWCKLGVDGFRMDAVKHIFLNDEITRESTDTIIADVSAAGNYSSNLTKNLQFWKWLNATVKADYPNAYFVGENFDGHAYRVSPYYEGFDALFDFYTYFNLTSAAATGLGNASGVTAAGFFTGTSQFGSGSISGAGPKTEFNLANGAYWNAVSAFETYNKYRADSSSVTSGSALPATFTSNHDIARTINRIHFTSASASGIEAQGNVTASDYYRYNKAATLVKITELMMPGTTYIYYGDEIGMTGNFPTGMTSKSDYSDLWYRQPMKWKQDGTVGDGSFTTSYGVTGSGKTVQWDDINKTTAVADAASQAADNGSTYAAIAKFGQLKSGSATLIRGSFKDSGSSGSILNFTRALGSDSYIITINFQALSASVSHNGSVVASY